MIKQRLIIIDDKTEFLFIGTREQLTKIDTWRIITIGERDIDPGLCARNLGVWFDSQLNISTHVTKLCNAAFYHLHNTRWIKKYLSRNSLVTLIHAFIILSLRLWCLYGYFN